MAFNFGTPGAATTPVFGAASGPAFGASSTPTLAKTSSTPLFGTPAPQSTPSLFGATSAPAFSFSTPTSQPAQAPSLFGAQPTAQQPQSTPAFSFPSTFGAPQQQQQQQQQLGFAPQGGAGAPPAVPDDSAIKELQSIRDSYIPAPGNHRHRFQYLFLNVVENPAARIKPSDVEELQWREALRRAGGPENSDHLWPVQAIGFKGLLARKAAQDEAIKEHRERLQAIQEAVAKLEARHEAVLRSQLERVKKRTATLRQQLLRILHYVDLLEGRFAHAMGYRNSSTRETLQTLSSQLATLESSIASGTSGGLQGKVEALVAAARLQTAPGGGRSMAELEAGVDPTSLHSAFTVLNEYSEALSRMQSVMRRCQREVVVLDELASQRE